MKIALIGYGKMGKAIEEAAQKRGHEIILRIGRANQHAFTREHLAMADVAIEFTSPESALHNVMKCMEAGLPVICGSTGWNKQLYLAKEKCAATNTAFLQASNFSIGVNIFFEINKRLAAIMNDWPEYEVRVSETHHVEKKDAPSGTAITIAEQIVDNLKRKQRWEPDPTSAAEAVSIMAHREEHVPGTHNVVYASAIDEIELIHTAHSREGFAFGAVLAAEFIQHRKGIFTMSDVLSGAGA